jgi:hypothetical protein
MSSYFSLPEKAQNEITRLSGKKKIQEELIKKEIAVSNDKGDSYICQRAKRSLTFHQQKLANAEREYQNTLANLNAIIEEQEQVIYNESHKKTPSIIRAEVEISSIKEQIEKIMNIATSHPITHSNDTPIEEEKEYTSYAPITLTQSEIMADMMRTDIPKNNVSYSIVRDSSIYGPVSSLIKKGVKTVPTNK